MILLLAGEKGGSGKSTVAVHLAIENAKAGRSVVLVDADPQGTVTNWLKRRESNNFEPEIPVVAIRSSAFEEEIPRLADQYEDIIIDVAGRDSAEMRLALSFVDAVLFPLRPTLNDLETAAKIDSLVAEFLTDDFYLKKVFFVLTQASTNIFRAGTNHDAFEYLEGYGNVDVFPGTIGMRSSFEKASIEGCSVSELSPPDAKATKEILDLYKKVF